MKKVLPKYYQHVDHLLEVNARWTTAVYKLPPPCLWGGRSYLHSSAPSPQTKTQTGLTGSNCPALSVHTVVLPSIWGYRLTDVHKEHWLHYTNQKPLINGNFHFNLVESTVYSSGDMDLRLGTSLCSWVFDILVNSQLLYITMHCSCIMTKFAGGTTILGLITYRDESAYRQEVQ